MKNFSFRSLLSRFGSESSDLESLDLSNNPLPPCPDSPNCIRYSRSTPASIDYTFESCLSVVEQMKPETISIDRDHYRIEATFKVFLFRDDYTIQLTPAADNHQTLLHIKSASREGYSDLGVNRRRVSTFMEKLERVLAT
ncbi:DUF1499 domain-containing protein [Fodinibius salsisoli]|uniref:DUF1499 domain-containing protein n=1 Tax=Fodinibius salsisoli TaxID=2820877 RepID=A0ABT3PLB6_9BACT|nr:DUF1499 domain-containing protein [Fodinibius salsisoli]MCW9706692.1 DUF1499 domain-containing protein [Fodinibius salsisoli]